MAGEAHVLELLPAYALGCLDEDETGLVVEHLAGCLVCRAELGAFQATADQLALPVREADPPPELKGRLMDRLQPPRRVTLSQPQGARRPFVQRLLPVWGLASLLLILALAAVNLWLGQRVNRLEVMTGPGAMRAIPLSGMGVAPQASGFVIISADGQNGALVVDELPPLDPAREYQLWLTQDGHSTSGAVFSTDADGYRGVRISAPGSLFEYSAVDITIEPAGGSSQPTGDQVLGGPLFNP